MGGSAGYGIGVHPVYCFGKSKFTNLKTHLSVCHFDKTSLLKDFLQLQLIYFIRTNPTGKSLGKLRKFK